MDYTLLPFRFVNVGLNLRDAPDKVSEGQWTRLHNVRSTQEAQIQPREGKTLFLSSGIAGDIHTLRRLADSTLLVGIGDQLLRNANPFPTAGYSGNPLSLVTWRPSTSTTSSWAYVADSVQMRKVSSDGSDFKWGISSPVILTFFSASPGGSLDSSVPGGTVYDWVYTYASSLTGAESNASPANTGITLSVASSFQSANVYVNPSADPQVDQINIYRRGGTLPLYQFVASVANVLTSYNDTSADSDIAGNELLHVNRDVPFTSVNSSGAPALETAMPYAWGPFLGKYIMACGATFQPGFVFWTNPQLPDEADPINNVEVTPPQEPLQNGLIYSSNPFVFSKQDLYALDFGNASAVTFVPRKTPCGKGLSAPWAFCSGPLIWFLSDDGIYETDGGSPARSITEEALRPIFRGQSVSDFSPVDYSQPDTLRLTYVQQEVHFFYKDTLGVQQELIYNIIYERWRSADSDIANMVMSYGDENVAQTQILMGGDNGNVYLVDPTINLDVGNAYTVNCRTGSLDAGSPSTLKEYGNVIIDADLQGNMLTVTPYTNAETTALNSFILSGSGRQKYAVTLGNVRAYNLAFDFNWFAGPPFGGIIYQMDVMYRLEEEAIRHWQFTTTQGQIGWQHVRDAYFTLVSNSPVTFTLNVDGVDYTYLIPSTGGLRLKQYVPLQPVKGKVFIYSLDADSDFQLFGNECEIRVKPWVTSLGYQLVSPFQDNVAP